VVNKPDVADPLANIPLMTQGEHADPAESVGQQGGEVWQRNWRKTRKAACQS